MTSLIEPQNDKDAQLGSMVSLNDGDATFEYKDKDGMLM